MAQPTKSDSAAGGSTKAVLPIVDAGAGSNFPVAPIPTTALGNNSNARQSRPTKVKDHYPDRSMTYYKVSANELREMGAASWMTTIFASAGTLTLSWYVDFSKDLALSSAASEPTSLLQSIVNVTYYSWLLCWLIAAAGFIWRVRTWGQIRDEHGESPWWKKLKFSFTKKTE